MHLAALVRCSSLLVVATLAACGGSSPRSEVPAAPTALPAQAELTQGGRAWAVYFAVAPNGSPELTAAAARTTAIGLELYNKDPGCDLEPSTPPPAADPEAIEIMLLAAYYGTEADARQVAAAFGEPVPWVGEVKTMCLD